VGDFVKAGDNMGNVEEIGLRSTRIRTLQRTVVRIPNGQLSNVSLENISVRDKFWFHHMVSLCQQTSASTMRAILDGVKNLLAQHPSVESSSVRVSFLGFGTSSLDVELYAYVAAVDFGGFLLIQQDLLLEVMVRRTGMAGCTPAPRKQMRICRISDECFL
jgi:MscS family membrane protein